MKKGTFLWLGRMGLPLSLALCHIYPLAAQNKVILPDSIPWMLSDSLMRGGHTANRLCHRRPKNRSRFRRSDF